MIIQMMSTSLDLILEYTATKPKIILLQSGIYAAENLQKQMPEAKIYALRQDCEVSGIKLGQAIELISNTEWVELCAKYKPVITIQD